MAARTQLGLSGGQSGVPCALVLMAPATRCCCPAQFEKMFSKKAKKADKKAKKEKKDEYEYATGY